MGENRLEQISRIERLTQKLPIKLQNAIFWAAENFDLLEEMGRQSRMTSAEIEEAIINALAEESYATLMLLFITKSVRESKEYEEI